MPHKKKKHNEKIILSINLLCKILHSKPFDEDMKITGFSIDSRTIKPGQVYIAIEGSSLDGHQFIQEAIDKGATAVIIHKTLFEHPEGRYIFVKNTLSALHTIAEFKRSYFYGTQIAITGSVGKTTTKEMLAHVLTQFGPTVYSKESFNNHWGVPLSLLNLEQDTQYGIFEIGMNHKGEIAPLAKLVKPDIAIITAIGEAHIGEFKNTKAIATEKTKIFSNFNDYHNEKRCIAIYNDDTLHADYIEEIAKKKGASKIIKCSITHYAQVYLTDYSEGFVEICGATEVRANIFGEDIFYKIPLIGKHYVINSLIVLATCHALNIDIKKAAKHLLSFSLPSGRGSIHNIVLADNCCITLIDDAYNANPTSMKAGLDMFGKYSFPQEKIELDTNKWIAEKINQKLDVQPAEISTYNEHNEESNFNNDQQNIIMNKPRKVAILGEMLELGSKSSQYHSEIEQSISENDIDIVFCCGSEMSNLFKSLPLHKRGDFALNAEELITPMLDYIRNGDMIYVKGSKASRVSKIVDYLLQNNLKNKNTINPFAD